MSTLTREPFPARNEFTTKITPVDADGEPLGFSPYTAGQEVSSNPKAWFHCFEANGVKVLTSVSGLFTTSVAHGLAVGDKIFFHDHTGSVNQAEKVVATIPTTKTFTVTGYSGNGTGGMFHKIMLESETGTSLFEKLYKVTSDTDVASYTVFKGAANVEVSKEYIIESWIDYGSGEAQLVQQERIKILPTYGSAP